MTKKTKAAFALITIIGALFFISVPAQAVPRWLQLRVKIIDQITKRPILYPQFAMYNSLDSTEVPIKWYGMSEVSMIRVPWGNASYDLVVMSPTVSIAGDNESMQQEIEKQGTYESERIRIAISDLKESDVTYDGPTISLSRVKNKKLNEVTVTASKVMFYNKGDTLIYNADAFVFSEGSSLDAIIEQMPGVELRKNGRIYVNGKFVETLLLNGKDLFNGDNQLMLENLPAFTVKDIAVYNHAGRSSRLMGYNTGDTKYVMDVRLKRQYRTGGLLNIEGGYGTSGRYLGKLFGLLFSDNVSFSAYGGANNLSDADKPGQSDGSWSSDRMGSGMSLRQLGGISYIAQGYENQWEAKGSIDVVNTLISNDSHTTTQTYLPQGDNFSYGWMNGRNKVLSVKTSHYFAFDAGNRASISLSPEFEFSRNSDSQHYISATLNSNYNDSITQEIVENIYEYKSDYRQCLLNRNLGESKYSNKHLRGKIRAIGDIKTKSTGLKNMLTLDVNIGFHNTIANRFNKFRVDYSESLKTFGNQYFKQYPSYDWNYSADLKFRQMLSEILYGHHLQLVYKYRGNNKTRTSNLYLLNTLNDDNYPIGILPPASIYETSIDKEQSYTFHTNEHSHSLCISVYTWLGELKDWNFSINYSCDLEFSDRRIRYLSTTNHNNHRTNLFPAFYLGNSLYKHYLTGDDSRKIKETNWDLNISGSPIRVSLLDAIDYINTSNPLYTIMGNPDIRDSYKIATTMKFNHTNYKRSQVHNANITYLSYINALTHGLLYNTSSGQQTECPYNINGNYDIKASYSFSTNFGTFRRFEISAQTTPMFSHTSDLFESYSDVDHNLKQVPHKRSVNTFSCKENVKFTWKVGSHRLTMKGAVEFRNYQSDHITFNNFSAWNSDVGISAILNFPYNWELSTDISLYMRNGYLDPILNQSDLIWNLRVSKSLFKGKIFVAIDGFDLLHQLSNISYRINSQARTEIVANTIPNYFLFHIRWNFNKSPKTK